MKEILIVHYTLQKEDIRKTTNKNGNEQFYYLYEEKKRKEITSLRKTRFVNQ